MLQQIYLSTTHPYQFELNKDFNLSVAHHIPCEETDICQNIHGHTYFTNLITISDKLDGTDFLMNLNHLKKMVHGKFDHQLLDNLPAFKDKIPSTRIVAETVYQVAKENLALLEHQLKCIRAFVRETPTSYIVSRLKEQV